MTKLTKQELKLIERFLIEYDLGIDVPYDEEVYIISKEAIKLLRNGKL